MLDAAAIEARLRGGLVDFRLACLDETTSTNDEIKRAIAAGAPEGTVATALCQVGGYGRQGRAWTSPEGGLYLSVLLRPADHDVAAPALPSLSLVTAWAVYSLFRGYTDDESLAIKWPNDVLCDRGKLCGISLEVIGGAVCLGIGVDVYAPAVRAKTGGTFEPAYLEELAAIPGAGAGIAGRDDLSPVHLRMLEDVAARLLAELDRAYATWIARGFSAFVEQYNQRAFLNGRAVEIASRSGDIIDAGTVLAADEHGNLLLRHADGTTRAIASGEAHIVL